MKEEVEKILYESLSGKQFLMSVMFCTQLYYIYEEKINYKSIFNKKTYFGKICIKIIESRNQSHFDEKTVLRDCYEKLHSKDNKIFDSDYRRAKKQISSLFTQCKTLDDNMAEVFELYRRAYLEKKKNLPESILSLRIIWLILLISPIPLIYSLQYVTEQNKENKIVAENTQIKNENAQLKGENVRLKGENILLIRLLEKSNKLEKYIQDIIRQLGVRTYISIKNKQENSEKDILDLYSDRNMSEIQLEKVKESFKLLDKKNLQEKSKKITLSLAQKCYFLNPKIGKTLPLNSYMKFIENAKYTTGKNMYKYSILFSDDLYHEGEPGVEEHVSENLKNGVTYIYILPQSKSNSAIEQLKSKFTKYEIYQSMIKFVLIPDNEYKTLAGQAECQFLIKENCKSINDILFSFDPPGTGGDYCHITTSNEIKIWYIRRVYKILKEHLSSESNLINAINAIQNF